MTNYINGRVVGSNGKTDGRDRQWADSLTLNIVKDIEKLPWMGNHYSDSELFKLCDRFIVSRTNREAQKQALYRVGKYGMGLNDIITDEMLDAYLADAQK